jgi:hypothetical protein
LLLTAKLHTSVGARSLETWVTCWKTSTLNFLTGPGGTAGSVGSTRSNGSNFTPFASAAVGAAEFSVPVAWSAGAAAGAAATGCESLPPVANATIETSAAIRATRPTRPMLTKIQERRSASSPAGITSAPPGGGVWSRPSAAA